MFQLSDSTALTNYCVLYQTLLVGLTHKYCHERNHGRYVPDYMQLLQNNGLAIQPVDHKKHHVELNCNFPFYNGWTTALSNVVIPLIDAACGLKQSEETIDICKEYVRKYGTIISIQFIGDFDGEIKVKLNGNILETV